MAEYEDREHFIPLRCTDLVDLLCRDAGPQGTNLLTAVEREQFRRFARMIFTHYHLEYHDQLIRLKDAYSPFDPDSDTVPLQKSNPAELGEARDDLFKDFMHLLEKANYKRLSREEAEKRMEGASYWGVDMDVEWDCFERVELYYRGSTIGKRQKRHAVKFWKVRTLQVPIFQRMVIILKQQEHKRLGKNPDTEHVFLKMFKDIPQMDLEMLLPGTKMKMPKLARGKLGGSLAFTVGWVGYKLSEIPFALVVSSPASLYAPAALTLGYGWRTWAGFQSTKQAYMLALTQSLYYQNLDNNAGVLFRLLDEAEEQECREALLGYFFLWRYAGQEGWTASDLDDYIELDLERAANLQVDFEIGDALDKLERLQLAEKLDGGRYRVVPLERAIAVLDGLRERYAAATGSSSSRASAAAEPAAAPAPA